MSLLLPGSREHVLLVLVLLYATQPSDGPGLGVTLRPELSQQLQCLGAEGGQRGERGVWLRTLADRSPEAGSRSYPFIPSPAPQ